MASVGFQAFAEAFLNKTAEGIDARVKEAEEYRQKQKELAERNKGAIAKRKAIVDQARGIANQARSNGATDEMIDAALAQGPTGLMDLNAQLSKVRTALGSRWTPEAAQNYVTLPEGFEGIEGSMEEKLRRTYGLPEATTGSVTADERSWWQKGLGIGARDAVRADLDKEAFYDGYSVMDINEAAAQAEYQSLAGGTFINFVTPKVFNPEDATSEVVAYNRIRDTAMETAKNSSEYIALKAKLEAAEGRNVLPGTPEAAAQKQEIADLTAQLNDYVRAAGNTALESYVRDRAAVFTGGGYLEAMGNTIDSTFGIEGVAAGLRSEVYGEEADTPEAAADTVIDTETLAPQVEAAGGKVVIQPETSSFTVEHPTLKDFSDTGAVNVVTDEDGKPKSVSFTMDGQEVESDDPQLVGYVINGVKRVRASERGTIDVTTAGRDFTGVAPEDMPKIDPRMITDEEVDQLTRQQLRAAGLKESELGQFLMFLPDGEERDRQVKQLVLKHNSDPEAWYSAVVPGLNLNRPMKVKGSDLQYIPDAALARGYNNIQISELAEGEDLPKRTWTKGKIQRTYETFDPQEPTADAAAIAEDVTEVTDGQPSADLAKRLENENDPMTQVLQKYGIDIVKFLESEGFTQADSEEEIAQGLADWYANNGEKLDLPSYPRDQGPMIYALKLLLKKD